jgi:hypothetical protein
VRLKHLTARELICRRQLPALRDNRAEAEEAAEKTRQANKSKRVKWVAVPISEWRPLILTS